MSTSIILKAVGITNPPWQYSYLRQARQSNNYLVVIKTSTPSSIGINMEPEIQASVDDTNFYIAMTGGFLAEGAFAAYLAHDAYINWHASEHLVYRTVTVTSLVLPFFALYCATQTAQLAIFPRLID